MPLAEAEAVADGAELLCRQQARLERVDQTGAWRRARLPDYRAGLAAISCGRRLRLAEKRRCPASSACARSRGRNAIGIQRVDDGGLLRLAVGDQAAVRRPQDHDGLPAERGRGVQQRRRACADADPRPRDPGRSRLRASAGEPQGRRHRRRQPQGLRPRRARNAGAAIPLARGARAARRRGARQGAVHVDHEHAAAALSGAHPRPQRRCAEGLLYRRDGVGQFHPRQADPVQPRPAGDPPARREDQFPAGHAADQFQIGALRKRCRHADPQEPAGRCRCDQIRSGDGRRSTAGQAQGARIRSSCRSPNGRCC